MLFGLPEHSVRTLERGEHRDIFPDTSQNCAADSSIEFRLLKWYSEQVANVFKGSKGYQLHKISELQDGRPYTYLK